MSNYVYGGTADIDRAIGYLVALDNAQRNALAVLEIDEAIDELQREYTLSTQSTSYVPSDDFIGRLSGYLEMADDRANPQLG
jgi:hypothetical protein